MSIASILGRLGLSALDIADTAKQALPLINLWDIAGGNANASGRFFRFVNKLVQVRPDFTRKEAAAAYGYAKYWANQGAVLSEMDPSTVLPRQLARLLEPPSDGLAPNQNFRTRVDVTITFSPSGDQRTFGVYVITKNAPQIEGVYAQAYESLLGQFRDKSLPISEGGSAPEWFTTFKIGEFGRYGA